MNATQVSIEELRTNLAELVGRVEYGEEKVVVTKYRRKAAVLISLKQYEKYEKLMKEKGQEATAKPNKP